MGEYDRLGKSSRSSSQPQPAVSGEYGVSRRTPRSSRALVKPPTTWLFIGLGCLALAPVPVLVTEFGTAWFALSYGLVVVAALLSVIALLVDQNRMRSPAYSLAGNFRKLGAFVYSLSTVGILLLIVTAAYRAATQ